VKWNGRHHELLLRFPPWKGEADGTFAYDHFGIKTDPRFRPQFRPQPKGPLETVYPSPHAGYFELIFLLESLFACESPEFTFIELGAGYGPWLVTAHRAAALSSGPKVNLVGVEMVPQHFKWMHDHLRQNGIDPTEHRLIHAAVSDRDGEALYRPEPDMQLDYGQQVLKRGAGSLGNEDATYVVPCIALSGLLEDHESVDLVHVDIQGEELRAIGEGLDQLRRHVRRLIVATHSRRIHRELRALLDGGGWERRYDFRMRKRERTEFGDIQFLDGLLACVNTDLEADTQS
jgi:FkbM family methyltransferase